MNYPNLLIVGAAKSGTTSLHEYLKQHLDIFMSTHKEPHFLINNEIGNKRIHRGVIKEIDYTKLFITQDEYIYKGESSVMYLMFPEITIPNIKKYLGEETRIIIMLRNPIERAYSGYLHNIRYNSREKLSFEEAIDISEERYHRMRDMTPATRYLELGLYYKQVKAFKENFQYVHIILYDDYVKSIDLVLDKLFNFLNLDSVKIDTSKRHMTGGWKWKSYFMRGVLIPDNNLKSLFKFLLPISFLRRYIKKWLLKLSTNKQDSMNPNTKKKLINFYKKDIHNLSEYLERDLSCWLN